VSISAKDLTFDLALRYGFQVLGALVILGVGLLMARWVGNLAENWLQKRALEPPARKLMVRVVRIVVLVFTLVVALDKFGFQIAPLVAGIGVAGLGIGIALQGVLSNVVAGLSIIFTKPFRVGEYVQVVGVHGQVSTIELFSTTLVHPDRSRIVIPNRKIVGEILHNYGVIRQLDLRVGVAYATDLGRAIAVARAVVETDPRVLKEPVALIGVMALGDSAIALAVRPWVAVNDEVPASGDLYRAVVERFREAGIDIPFPQREVRLLT
jgi:small conductance mechanosensitive channel